MSGDRADSLAAGDADKPKRRAISKKTRFEVFKRDGFACQYCGAHPPGVILHIDHIMAVAAGGTNSIDNLVTACEPCNLGKGARNLKVAPQSLDQKAKDIAEREAQLHGYQQIVTAKRLRLEDDAWAVFGVLYPGDDRVSSDEMLGTKRFIERLGLESVLDAAEIAVASSVHHRRLFRYFCGVCWNRIRELDR